MREGSGGKFDVHCFLFTDMLLVCKSLSRKGERVKVSMIMVIMMMCKNLSQEGGGGQTLCSTSLILFIDNRR